jgi:hypothetical protein
MGGSATTLPVLTLPGIAGIVLTVGMAVDANVLIFERIREEMRHGQALRRRAHRWLRQGLFDHLRREHHDAADGRHPVLAGLRPRQGLRHHAQRGHRGEHVHGDRRHPHGLRVRSNTAAGCTTSR